VCVCDLQNRYWTYCHVEAADEWDEGECGGFECIIPAEDEDNPEVVAAYDPQVGGQVGEGYTVAAWL
jgi:hypothetical protein